MTLAEMTAFLGWWTLINLVIYVASAVSVLLAGDRMMRLHARMFGIEKSALPALYMSYLARYKLVILAFNIAPYLALRWGM